MATPLFPQAVADVATFAKAVLGMHFEPFALKLLPKGHPMFLSTDANDASPPIRPEDFQNQLNDIRSQLDNISSNLEQNSKTLQNEVYNCAHDSVEKLQIALDRVEEIAVFIRGNYDDRTVDEAAKKAILDRSVSAFEDVQKAAEGGLRTIGDVQAKVVEIEKTDMLPQQQKLEEIAKQNEIYLQSFQASLAEAEHNTQVLENSVRNENNAINTLNDKIASSRSAALASDIGFSILTFGIGNAINRGPLDPFNLHGQLDDAIRARNDALNKFWGAVQHLTELRSALAVLQVRLNLQHQVQSALPLVKDKADQTVSNCALLEQRFAPLKAACTKMVLDMRKVQSDAIVARAVAYTKREFAAGVLQMALDALIDVTLVEKSNKLDGDVMTNYGSTVPDDVKALDGDIAKQILALKDLPSIMTLKDSVK